MARKLRFEEISILETRNGSFSQYALLPHMGKGALRRYELFKGILLNYTDIDLKKPFHGNIQENAEQIEVMYVQQGRVEIEYIDHKIAYINSGDIALIDCERAIRSCHFCGEKLLCFFLLIKPKLAAESMNMFLRTEEFTEDSFFKELKKSTTCIRFPVGGMVEHICQEFISIPKDYQIHHMRLKAIELILYLLSGNYTYQEDSIYYAKPREDRIREVAALLRDTKSRYKISELAEKICLNRTTLLKEFKQIYGMSLQEYQKNICMHQAKELLLNSDLSVTEIAMQCGYSNCSKFSARFAKCFGKTPLAYRKQY